LFPLQAGEFGKRPLLAILAVQEFQEAEKHFYFRLAA
jgi:hypothetical protein